MGREITSDSAMFEDQLKKIRAKILAGQYVMTIHAEEEMNDDSLSIFDVEAVILSGTIKERQKDKQTGEFKYRIQGKTMFGWSGETVVKFTPTGKIVIITVYAL